MFKLKAGKIVAIIIPLILGLALIAVSYLWIQDKKQIEADRAVYQQQVNEALAKWGSEVTVYTVKTGVHPGDLITKDSLVSLVIPSKADSSYYIKDTSTIIGKYFKIAVTNPTILTNDMVMDEKLTDDMRSFDLLLTSYSTGLRVGDYIDIYFTAPYGDRYIVLPKVKVRKIQKGGLLTAYMTSAQRHVYTGALVDYYLNSAYGAMLTGELYIEPGLQQEAVSYYQVPENISALMQMDPNVSADALEELNATASQRNSIEQALMIFRTSEDTVMTDAAKLIAGREATTSAVTSITTGQTPEDLPLDEAAALWSDESSEPEVDTSTTPDTAATDAAASTEATEPQTAEDAMNATEGDAQ